MSMHSPYFDLTAPLTTVDMDQNVYSKVSWIPKETLLDRKVLDAIKDEKELRAFAKTSLEILYKDNPNLFADHAKLKLNKK